jgi:hypothetical protein
VKAVKDGPSEDFAERSGVALIGAAERVEVAGSVSLANDDRRQTETNQQQVENEATGPSVPVQERVNLLEACVQSGEPLWDVGVPSRVQRSYIGDPGVHEGWYLGPCWRAHPRGERRDVVLAE